VFGLERWKHVPAADGQNGTIVRMYRDWKLSGDSETLRSLWPSIARAVDFAFDYWDSDKDFVLDSQQHNTYDIEFYGPNSLSNSMFYAALKAGVEMARFMGDVAHVERWQAALDAGSRRMDEMLWGGEYYVQKLADVNAHRYQYGSGCLSDQVFGQLLAHVAGLGYVLPEKHVKKALASIFRYNFLPRMKDHHNVQRTYALGDEAGLLLCSWPHGGRPRFPFVYADEVWTGIEYQVAAHLVFEGLVEEGLSIVKAVRDRHDGVRRNPYSEVECGHHYARSMSSWAVLVALGGFRCDMVEGTMDLAPAVHEDDFSTFFSTGKAWGIYRQNKDRKTGKTRSSVEVLHGSLDGVSVNGGKTTVLPHKA
jgi:non-lysosomal glucosylceramidase